MKISDFFSRKNKPVWLAAGGTVLIVVLVSLLFAPPPMAAPLPPPESGRCFLLELQPVQDAGFVRWLDEHDPALLVRSDAARSAVMRLAPYQRAVMPMPVWVRPEVRAYASPPPEPEMLPVTAVKLPMPTVVRRRRVVQKAPVQVAFPRIWIDGRCEPLAMPDIDMTGAGSDMLVYFSPVGDDTRYRVVESSGDAGLDMRMVRELLRRRDKLDGEVRIEWREKW